MFQNSVQKYFQSLLVIYFQTKKKAQRYVSKPTNSVWMKQLSLVEAKPELNLQQKQVMQGTYHAHCSLRFFGLDRLDFVSKPSFQGT